MNILLFIKQAFLSIISNKLRSFLSTLGIIIGISSFVIMLSLGEGAKQSMLKDFSGTSDVITIGKNYDSTNNGNNIINEKIALQIEENVPGVNGTLINYDFINSQANYLDITLYGSIKGVQQKFFKNKELELAYGSYFDEKNYKNSDKVIILGNKLIKSTFNEENPIGKKINIGGEIFIISGILKEKNREIDYNMFIPNTVSKKIFNQDTISNIEVIVIDEKFIEIVKKKLDIFLYKSSGVNNKEDVTYRIRTNKEQLKQMNDFIGKFTLLLGGIGAIALIVGGIGIMNIMLVSVTERTREIGIRKAIGATNMNIMSQFLIESIILTLIGSVLAILFSYGIVMIIDKFIPDFSPIVNINVILIATSVSICMGVLFGLMPAYKAAKLKPIDALHFE